MERDAENDEQVIEKISRQDLHLETTARLAKLIAVSAPGSRLPTERELCEKLGVGRSTLREAVHSLSFVGAVQARQGSGTYVRTLEDRAVDKLIGLGLTLQRATVREVIEARRALEVESVRLAAERHTDSDRQGLMDVMRKMAEVAGDPGQASHLDLEYHVLLAQASHNRVLVHFINGMRGLLEIWIDKAVNRAPVVDEIVREHNQVLEAVFARDPDSAAERMNAHLTQAADRLFAVVGEDQSMADYIAVLLPR